MKFFAIATTGPQDPAPTPAETQSMVEAVGAWFEKYGAQGKIAWNGHQLAGPETARTIRAGADGALVVTDGPFVEAKEGIGGIATLECESMDEAVEISTAWASEFGLTLELRPVLDM